MDEQSFAQRVRACERKLYNTAFAIVSREADCEDCMQEALLKAWTNIGTLRDAALFETWLMRILINECRMVLRRRASRRETALQDGQASRASDASGESTALRDALWALDERYRLALLLHFGEGYDIASVAKMLSITQGAAKWRIHRGKAILRERLKREEARL